MAYKDKDYMKKYYQNNEERILKQHREQKEKKREYDKKYRKEHFEERKRANIRYQEKLKFETPWIIYYFAAKTRCKNLNNKRYHRYGGRGIRFLLTQKEMEILYKRDHAENMKHPSIDRIDNDGNYCFDNCRFIEFSENARRYWIELRRRRCLGG